MSADVPSVSACASGRDPGCGQLESYEYGGGGALLDKYKKQTNIALEADMPIPHHVTSMPRDKRTDTLSEILNPLLTLCEMLM